MNLHVALSQEKRGQLYFFLTNKQANEMIRDMFVFLLQGPYCIPQDLHSN